MDGRTHDGHNAMTIARWPSASGAKNHHEKKRKCWYAAFSPFPTMFSTLPKRTFDFLVTFILSSANPFNLDQPKIFFVW